MQYRVLGASSLRLSTIGFGTWAIGGSGWQYAWGPQDDHESIAAIRHALDCGINWIDTAAVYGKGHSEEVVGRAIRGLKDKPLIATKCGRHLVSDGTVYGCLKRDNIRCEAENSLRRLGIDVIDLYQIHWPIPEEDIEEAWEEIAKLVDEGKVRYAGVSNFSVRHIERINKIHPVISNQPPYSMLHRDIEIEIIPYCAAQNIGVIVYSPLAKGLLTGAFSPERVALLPEDDHRRNDMLFSEISISSISAMLAELRPIAERYNMTYAQFSIAWILNRHTITSAIVGARKPSQIEETSSAAEYEFTAHDMAEINQIIDRHINVLK
jgi:aryl-alcohol dehydrogenase-like predicted oxidoreductase